MRACLHCDAPAVVVAITREGAFDLCPNHDAGVRAMAAARVLILEPIVKGGVA